VLVYQEEVTAKMDKEITFNKILNAISHAISQHKSIEEILNISVKMIAGFFSVDICNIYIYDSQSNRLILSAVEGFDKSFIGNVSLSEKEGLVGHVFSQQQAMQLISPYKSEHYYYVEGTNEEKLNSFMGFPIISHNKCWGVLTLQCYEEKFYLLKIRISGDISFSFQCILVMV